MTLTALPYLGGKSAGGLVQAGRWIAGLLPPATPRQTYVESHGGMAGILLQRRPAGCELVNDLDGRIVGWWRIVRDRPHDLAGLVAATPRSRDTFEEALTALDDPDPLRRAWAVTVTLTQSVRSSLDSSPSSWRRTFVPGTQPRADTLPTRIIALASRMAKVQLENVPAMDLLERLSSVSHAVIYVDPPYADRRIHYGRESTADLTAVLLAQTGSVAVSGYCDEWDHLGWDRHEHATRLAAGGDLQRDERPARTEVLWTNYAPPRREASLF